MEGLVHKNLISFKVLMVNVVFQPVGMIREQSNLIARQVIPVMPVICLFKVFMSFCYSTLMLLTQCILLEIHFGRTQTMFQISLLSYS